MDQIYKTVPEGAVVTKAELHEHIKSKHKLYAVITTGTPASDALDKFGTSVLLVADVSRAHFISGHKPKWLKGVIFSDTPSEMEMVELARFSIGKPMGNYFFTNYWHAYAYKLRTEL